MKKTILAVLALLTIATANAKDYNRIEQWSNGTYWGITEEGEREQITEEEYIDNLARMIREELDDRHSVGDSSGLVDCIKELESEARLDNTIKKALAKINN